MRSVRGRDLAVEDIPASLAKLDAWQAAITASISRLETEAGRASASYAAGKEMAGAVSETLALAVQRAAATDPDARMGRRGAPGGYGDAMGPRSIAMSIMSRLGGGRRGGGLSRYSS